MDRPIETKTWTGRRALVAAAGAVLLFFTSYLLLADLGTSKLNVDPQRITIGTVSRGSFQEFIPLTGNVVPLQIVSLDTADGGRVEEIFLREGSPVTAGQPILRLGNTDLQLDYRRQEDQLAQQINQLFNTRLLMKQQKSEAERRLEEIDYQTLLKRRVFERNAELAKDNLVSAADLELSRDEYQFLLKQKERALAREKEDEVFRQAQIAQMEQGVDSMRRNLALAQEKLDKITVRSPIDGELTALDAEIGQLKAPGASLGQIDAADGFKVRANADQIYVSRVEVGQTAAVTLNDREIPLRVAKIYPEVTDGRFQLDLQFDGGPPPGIKRGQTLSIRLTLGDVSQALRLPRGAFFQDTGGQWAFVVDEDGRRAVRRPIRLGRQNPEYFEVLEGLEAGERAVTSSYKSYGEFDELVLEN